MEDLFGVPMRVGSRSQSEQRTTAVGAEPVEHARAHVEEQGVAHRDETSGRQGGQRAWLWVAVTSMVTTWKVSCNLLNLRKQFTAGFFRAIFINP